MKQKLQFKVKIKEILALSLFFVGCLGGLAQGATFTSVNPATDVLTITNTGSSMVNVTDYWLCLGPGTYVRVGTVTPISGDYMLSADESVTLSYNVTEAQDGLSLFSTNSFGSSDPNVLVSFVQWGAANQPRAGQAVTAGRWDDINNFVSGSGPYTTTNGGSAAAWMSTCDAEGGAIQIAGTTDTSTTICVGEGVDDLIDVEFVDMSVLSGDSSTWVITDQATGDILGTPAAGPFNLEGAPTGICDIWYLRYTGDIGLGSATNVADLSGCFDLSNPISVSRNAVNGGAIQIAGTTDTSTTICVGEGVDDLIDVEFVDMSVLSGDSSTWVITDQATGDILGTPAAGPFNLEGAPTGICDIWYLRYTGDIGLGSATNVADLSGCFDLSNPISVSRNAVNGGAIQIAGTTDTSTTICVGEGVDDLIDVEFVDMSVLSGDSSTWVITDQATGDILGTPAAGPFNLEGAPTGICDIWYLRYTGDIGLGSATNVADLSGCFDLSNPISVSRNAVNGGAIQIAGTTDTSTTICVGEGVDDLIDVEFVDMSVLSGDSSTWVITDQATGDILGTPAAGPFNLEGAPTGICDIWYLRYTGDIGLGSATNVADLSGCFDLSNPISVSRNAVNGGAIQIAGTTDTSTTICVGEGVDDLIDVEFVDMSVLSGDSSTWVITDQATGDILGTPAAGPFNLEGAPTGICDIWYLRYTGDIGLGSATNVADLSGCFDLSNPISVSRNAVNGGAIQIAGTTDTSTTICVGEGVDDLIDVEFVDMSVLSGDSSTWVITDQATGDILGTPAAGPFNLEGAPTGICDIWYLRYTGDIGLGSATNVADLSGCFDLSNPISVSRNAVNGGAIQIAGTTDTATTICVGEGVDDLIDVEFVDMSVLSGDSSTWVITDQATGDILGTPAAGPFNLEGAPTGVCDIWYLRYTGDIGLGSATNVADLSGCFDLSNPISVSRNAVNGGAIQIAGTTDTSTTICVGEGVDDLIDVEFVDMSVLSGDSSTWVITDQATGDILGTPAAGPFNLEGAPTGICDIWYLRYTGDIGLGSATNVADLSGCFDLSNPISVSRNAVNGGAIQIAGTTDTATTICVGEGVDDLIDVEFVDMSVLSGDSSTWVITDQATGDILGTPAAGPFNLEGAPTGVCDIWYLRYTGDIGLGSATNVADLSGCFDLSNPISVSRNAVNGGAIQIAGTNDTTASICVGEGTDDLIDVEFVDASVLSGDSSTWVITDQATGDILGTPAAGPFNLEGAPAGICDIWYLRYTGDIGLATASNVADLSGCFDLSNPISITRFTGMDCMTVCDAQAGEIQIAGTTDTSTTICVGEGVDDLIDVEFVDMSVLSGDSSTWVITDQATGDILGTPAAGPFNLEGAPTGVCDIWYLRYTGDIGLGTATNVADLSGCFDLSNPISVLRNAVNGGAIQIAGTTDTSTTICVGEGVDDLIAVEFVDMSVLSGDSSTWVITDQATGNILGTPAAGPFNLEGAPTGVCDIWYLRYTGDIGLATATNVADLSGCFDLSNPISVSRNAVNGGAIQIAGTTDTTASICVGEGIDDLIDVEFVDAGVLSGDSSTWVITDQATGDILGTPAAGPFNLEGAPAGICDIWYLRYTGEIGLATASNVADLSGCFDLSNPISITRLTGMDCDALSIDDFNTAFDFSIYPNPTKDIVNISFGGNRTLDVEIQVIDVLGKQVYTTTVTNEEDMRIDMSDLESGTYFMNITDMASGNRIVKRMIKN